MAKQGRRLRGEQTVQRARHCIGADRAAQVQPLLQAHNAHLDALVVLRQLLQAGVAHLARHRRQPLRQQLLAASKQDVVNFSNNQQLGRQPLCQLLLTVAVRLLAILAGRRPADIPLPAAHAAASPSKPSHCHWQQMQAPWGAQQASRLTCARWRTSPAAAGRGGRAGWRAQPPGQPAAASRLPGLCKKRGRGGERLGWVGCGGEGRKVSRKL